MTKIITLLQRYGTGYICILFVNISSQISYQLIWMVQRQKHPSITFESLIQVLCPATNLEDARREPIRDRALETTLVTPSVQSGCLCSQKSVIQNQKERFHTLSYTHPNHLTASLMVYDPKVMKPLTMFAQKEKKKPSIIHSSDYLK